MKENAHRLNVSFTAYAPIMLSFNLPRQKGLREERGAQTQM